jgi:putative hydroxymethylpyrimidine transport system substrate-binding protein
VRRSVLDFVVVAAVVVVLAPVAAGGGRQVTLLLDWTPNPDHVGFYYARDKGMFAKAGLEVSIRAPSDPTSPLRLVAAGKTDFAVSYEQEVLIAAAKKLPVVAVAAVVPQALNSIMAIEPRIRSLADLKGKTIGITGVPSDDAALDTALASAGLHRSDVRVVSVGYNLLPALLAHRVDAVLGVYRNVEGIELAERGLRPTIIPLDRAGVPPYDELVLVASASRLRSDPAYVANTRAFVRAFLAGTAAARRDKAGAIRVLQKVTASSAHFLDRATPATLALLTGPGGVGCLRTSAWQRFVDWMRSRSLLNRPVAATTAMTMRFLPTRCR